MGGGGAALLWSLEGPSQGMEPEKAETWRLGVAYHGPGVGEPSRAVNPS